jgi:hypothetical protein
MSQSTKEPLWKSLMVAIVPLFFGILLFGGLLESYKNDASARKEIMNDFYRPMRETQSDCQKIHNNLFLKYGQVAGSYQLMIDEFKHLTITDPSKMTKEYQIFLESILSNHTKADTDAKELEGKLDLCRAKLFRQYEELALVTGTYKKFTKLSEDRASKINNLYAARKSLSEKLLKDYDAKELMEMVRNLLQLSINNQEQKIAAAQKINEIAGPVIQYYLQLSENEQEIFKIEIQISKNLHEIFSTEINDRFERGFIARHFF